jgi:hypothetical protein
MEHHIYETPKHLMNYIGILVDIGVGGRTCLLLNFGRLLKRDDDTTPAIQWR